MSFGDFIKQFLPVSGATAVLGMAYKINTLSSGNFSVSLGDNTVTHLQFVFNSDLSITAKRGVGGTVLGSTNPNVIDTNAGYCYIEFRSIINDTSGEATIRINGNTVLNLTSIDTQNGGTAGWTWFLVAGAGNNNGSSISVDDLYVLDGSGSSLNDFIGDTRIDAHYPVANGTTSNSTPSTGTDRSATIDEHPPNGDTDYNTLTAVGDLDTLSMQDLINTGTTPDAIQMLVYARKTDAGAGDIATALRHSGTNYFGSNVSLSDSAYRYAISAYGLDPTGAAWTETSFNALEAGYKRTA
jgi:hypothetical protein